MLASLDTSVLQVVRLLKGDSRLPQLTRPPLVRYLKTGKALGREESLLIPTYQLGYRWKVKLSTGPVAHALGSTMVLTIIAIITPRGSRRVSGVQAKTQTEIGPQKGAFG